MLGKRLFNVRVGLLAALLFAVNALAVRYGQEARSYSLTVLLVVLSSLFFLDAIAAPRWQRCAAYVVTSVLAVYAHPFASLVIAAQGISLLLWPRGRVPWLRMIACEVAIVILVTPELYLLLTTNVGQTSWLSSLTPVEVIKTLPFFAGVALWTRTAPALLLSLLYGAMIALGVRYGMRTADEGRARCGFALLALCLPFPVLLALTPIRVAFQVRYLLPSLPFFVILAAAGLTTLRPPAIGVGALIAVLCLALYQDADYYVEGRPDDWNAMVSYIVGQARPRDAVLMCTRDARWPYDYYADHSGVAAASRPIVIFPAWNRTFRVAGFYIGSEQVRDRPGRQLLDSLSDSHPDLWIIATSGKNRFRQDVQSDPPNGYTLVSDRKFHVGDVMLFSSVPVQLHKSADVPY